MYLYAYTINRTIELIKKKYYHVVEAAQLFKNYANTQWCEIQHDIVQS